MPPPPRNSSQNSHLSFIISSSNIRGNSREGLKEEEKKVYWSFEVEGDEEKLEERGSHGKSLVYTDPSSFCFDLRYTREVKR